TYKELEEEGGQGCSGAEKVTDDEPKAGTAEANQRAFDSYRKAIQGFDLLIKDHGRDPNVIKWRLQRADVFADLGDLHIQRQGNVQAAKEAFETALKERREVQELLAKGGQTVRIPTGLLEHDIGWMHNKLADVHRERREHDQELEAFVIAEKLIEGIGDALQSNKHWLNHLLIVRNNIGLVLFKKNDLRRAEGSFRQAIVEGGELSRRYPENQYIASNLAWSHDNLAELLVLRGRAEESYNDLNAARQNLALAHAAREKFVACKPLWRRDQLFNRALLAAAEGGIAELQGNSVAAAGHYALAADTGWALADAKAHDERLLSQLLYMVEFRRAAADALRRAARPTEATAEIDKGLAAIDAFVKRANAQGFGEARARLLALRAQLAQ
ncbi:MAG TPA: hypothetical protein VEC14_04875, partial [Reyranellaceae bacterium]|nr:hypothetical protein [Reyranellaceae bacterium]